jgi:O-antigen ligase
VLLHGEERRERLAAAGFLVITAAAVILSLSRAGWAALLAVAVFVSLFHRWRLRVLVGVLAVALVGVVAVPPIRRRVEVELDPTSPFNTIRLRLALWKSAIEMLKHHPLFGGGLSGFARSVEPYRDRNYGERLIYPHNIVLNFWSETGLIGLLGFAWLCAWMVRTSWRGLGSTGMGRVISIGVLGMLVAFAVHGIADVPYFKNDQALAFWALLGIQVGVLRQPLPE